MKVATLNVFFNHRLFSYHLQNVPTGQNIILLHSERKVFSYPITVAHRRHIKVQMSDEGVSAKQCLCLCSGGG